MSFNGWLRKLAYGDNTRQGENLFLKLPAGITGTTWQGTGFEEPPAEPVVLDDEALPWELQEDVEADPTAAVSRSEALVDADDVDGPEHPSERI